MFHSKIKLLLALHTMMDNDQVLIESDWSAASYWYGMVALSENGMWTSLLDKLIQADSVYLRFTIIWSKTE